MISKKEAGKEKSISENSEPDTVTDGASKDLKAATASETQPAEPEKPHLEPQSPSSKRRQSEFGPSSAGSSSQNVTPKRARGAQTAVKILPIKYEFCGVEDMVILIANMISELIATNDGLPLRTGVLTRFHSR